jgi:hypothetical protein
LYFFCKFNFIFTDYMKKITFFLSILLIVNFIQAQNVGINATGATPAASAMLDIVSTNQGLLVPRIALSNVTVAAPVTAPAVSLIVYNTATAGVSPNDVTPGFYYWDGAKWIAFSGSGGKEWALLGNAGNTPVATPAIYGTSTIGTTEHFLGTTDANDVVFATNNIERMRVKQTTGLIGIGLAAPTTKLDVFSGSGDAIFGHSSNVGGYLGRETNISFGTPAQTLLGAGLYAANPSSGYTSAYAQSTGLADVAASINYSSVWMGSYNYVENTSSVNSPSAVYSQLNNTSTTLTGYQSAIRGFSNRGATAGNAGTTAGGYFTAVSQNQSAFGVVGLAYSDQLSKAGGYFESETYAGANQAFAYVATTVAGVARKIAGTNAVSEIIPTPTHGRIILTCPESPEYWYQDYGTVELVNGKAHVDLDPILADIIVVNKEYPIRVFCTPADMLEYNGVAIVNRTATGFDIIEVNGGVHSGVIDYQLIVKPKTGYGEGRFPQAPGPAWLKADREPSIAKAQNQTLGKNVFYWPSDWEVYGYEVEKMIGVGDMVPAGPNKGKFKVAEGVFMDQIPAQKPVK